MSFWIFFTLICTYVKWSPLIELTVAVKSLKSNSTYNGLSRRMLAHRKPIRRLDSLHRWTVQISWISTKKCIPYIYRFSAIWASWSKIFSTKNSTFFFVSDWYKFLYFSTQRKRKFDEISRGAEHYLLITPITTNVLESLTIIYFNKAIYILNWNLTKKNN